jgi:hypothetical protein
MVPAVPQNPYLRPAKTCRRGTATKPPIPDDTYLQERCSMRTKAQKIENFCEDQEQLKSAQPAQCNIHCCCP